MKKLKKFISIILNCALALIMLSGANIVSAKKISVELDGKELTFDVDPQIIDGRTMVPIRKIFEEIGALVKWNSDTQTITARKSSKTVTLSVGSKELNVDIGDKDNDGNSIVEIIQLDIPAQINDGRTLVPIRAISESFGLNVDWNEDEQKILITSDIDDDSWKDNKGTIDLSNLSYTGDGINITNNQFSITSGGDFTLTGTLNNGNIVVSTNEAVKLRLSNVSITTKNEPCIFIENSDKTYITITENTENILVAENSENGAIYAKDNLEIKGNGTLNIESSSGHGIKASDNLTIKNGNININAKSDGIHVNDTFKMTDGNLNIISECDGIGSESIVNISGGIINIKTNGVPTESSNSKKNNQNEFTKNREEVNDVEFEKSTKGINAEWMIYISGGNITINSASHAIHCQDEIQIDGGNLSINSTYEKGISAHGNLTIDGEETSIDIIKSTEGIESKNIMTINNGFIKVYSTDDALNATGGNSGTMDIPRNNFDKQTDSTKHMQPDGNEKINSDQIGRRNTKPNMNENGTDDKFIPQFTRDFANNKIDDHKMFPDGEIPQMNGEIVTHDNSKNKNFKDCLVINNGYLELYAEDDCIDSNGNLIINGGTIKATNPTGSFAGAFAVIDPDGKTVISENATLIFATGSGDERNLNISQNTIVLYCNSSHSANESIIVSDTDNNIMYEYSPVGAFNTVLICSKNLVLNETYIITVGEEKYEAALSNQNTIIGIKNDYHDKFAGKYPMP